MNQNRFIAWAQFTAIAKRHGIDNFAHALKGHSRTLCVESYAFRF